MCECVVGGVPKAWVLQIIPCGYTQYARQFVKYAMMHEDDSLYCILSITPKIMFVQEE